MQITTTKATNMIVSLIKAKLVAMLTGSPGIGKSSIIKEIANRFNLKLIDVRLAQCDPTDLCGFPSILGNKAGYVPMDTFPIETDPIPEGYSGWIILFDEMTSASPAVQAAAYKIVLDRMIGVYKLHPNVAIVCAGNLETDNAIVQPMSTALQSRLVHLELVVDAGEWCDWAMATNIDHRITDYIKFKPGNLYTFSPDHTDKTYACPRTWEFANRILNVIDLNSVDALPLLAGTLSEGVAREFIGFTNIYNSLPKMSSIQASPETVPVPTEPSILFALTGSIAHNANPTSINQLIKYVSRLPVEFQVVTLRETVRRNKSMLSVPAVQKWAAESSDKLF